MLSPTYIFFLSLAFIVPFYMYTTVGIYYVVDFLKYLSESPFDPESFIVVGAGMQSSFVQGGRGHWAVYYTSLNPKFENNGFSFVGLTILGIFIEFLLVGTLSWMSNR